MSGKRIVLDRRVINGLTHSLAVEMVQYNKELPPQLMVRVRLERVENGLGMYVGVSHASNKAAVLFPKYNDLIKFDLVRANGVPQNVLLIGERYLIGASQKLRDFKRVGHLTFDHNSYLQMFCDHVRISYADGHELVADAEALAEANKNFNITQWLGDWMVQQVPRWKQEFDEIVERYNLVELLH